jgi:hypothetical protein
MGKVADKICPAYLPVGGYRIVAVFKLLPTCGFTAVLAFELCGHDALFPDKNGMEDVRIGYKDNLLNHPHPFWIRAILVVERLAVLDKENNQDNPPDKRR